MTEHDLTEAEREVELQHIADAARHVTDGYDTDLADEQDGGPRMFQTLSRFALLFGAVVLTIAALIHFAKQ